MADEKTTAAGPSAEARLAAVAAIETVYSAKLAVAVSANRDDARFVSGVTHASVALERVRRALAGETDPVRLGIADPETRPAAAPVELDLFSETG